MAGALAPRFSLFKKRSNEFEMGQLCLLLCISYRVLDDKVNTIDGHFARLLEHSPFALQIDSQGQLWKDGSAWKFRCMLPLPEEDMLLHLTMTGGPSFRPFSERLYMIMRRMIQPPVHCDNTEQRSNDGMGLEALTAAAIVLASHAGGFGGVAFPTFLRELLFELGVYEPGMTLQLPRDIKTAGGKNLIVPFLSPPNEKWPEWLLTDTSIRFDNFVRTRNKDCIDFRITSNLISGECKDYSSVVKLDVMKKILSRIPEESTIHLVVVNTLQTEYFIAESSWEAFVNEHNFRTSMSIASQKDRQ
ncbi:hypothetical protein AM587_10000226 [Phytophthora nicotianae]|uniref:Crinkler (CRN) family protein n=1 Tax=Phytophthora nicotianae TaxID=4792 RepID=A0A0W8CB61_PHYNI|nr:hypothetical protein AM587_10000226 [Phytophthora nicotianae]